MFRVLSIAAIAFFSLSTANAGPAFSSHTRIVQVENSWYANGVAIWIESNAHGISGCGAPNGAYFLRGDHPAFDTVLSIVMTAFATQATVEVIGDQGVCEEGNKTRVLGVRIEA